MILRLKKPRPVHVHRKRKRPLVTDQPEPLMFNALRTAGVDTKGLGCKPSFVGIPLFFDLSFLVVTAVYEVTDKLEREHIFTVFVLPDNRYLTCAIDTVSAKRVNGFVNGTKVTHRAFTTQPHIQGAHIQGAHIQDVDPNTILPGLTWPVIDHIVDLRSTLLRFPIMDFQHRVFTLLAIHRFRDSPLSALTKDCIQLVARALWNMRKEKEK